MAKPPLAGYPPGPVVARTRCLYCGLQKRDHKGKRHAFRPRRPWMTDDGSQIDDETYEVSTGPLTLDVKMALEQGWGEKAILRVLNLFPHLIPRRVRPAPTRDQDEIRARTPRKPDRRTGTDRRAELRRVSDRAARRLARR